MDIKHKISSALPYINGNVGTNERVISLLLGSYLLYDALLKEKKSYSEATLAGYLMLRGISGFCPFYKALEIGKEGFKTENINIRTNISINKPRNEIYEFWRNVENLPLFMKHIHSVTKLDDTLSVWEANIPGGKGNLSWRSEVVKDIPNEHIGWQSLEGADIFNAGNVKFLDAGKYGTEVHVVISYQAPVGKIGEEISRLFTPVFERMIREDVKNLKRFLETDEIPTIEGQSRGMY